MRDRGAKGVVLDAGALIAIERRDRFVLALCLATAEAGGPVIVPAGVVGQVWRDGSRQVGLSRLLGARDTIIEPLDLEVAKLAGVLCGRAGTSDVLDATVVISASRHRASVVTSDGEDIRRLDDTVSIVAC
jgi:hypothetical protein